MVDAKGSFSWTAGDPDKPFDAKALGKVLARNPNGHLYHFRYPLKDDPSRFIVVATTRPETMLGDTAVAVHPDDRRYKDLVGKTVVLPLVGREIPIIADDYADPEKGSGAVKITPAHDFNDYRVYQRHPEIGIINIFDATAHLNDEAPPKYRKMDRLTARRCVVEDLEAQGLVEKIESTVHAVPHAQRGNAVIEPWLTDQWYVECRRAGEAGDGRRRGGQDPVRAEKLGEDLLRVDAQHRALVHLAPDLVGASNPGVVRASCSWRGWPSAPFCRQSSSNRGRGVDMAKATMEQSAAF